MSQPPGHYPAEGDPPGQLYDLASDPREEHNVWAERPELVAELLTLLDALREEHDAEEDEDA